MKSEKQQDLTADQYVVHPSKRKADGFWPQMKEETNDRIVVNVGGTCFETSRQTLCLDANSMLTAIVARHSLSNSTLWFDRDAGRFGHVLNYLRNGTVCLNDIPTLRGLLEEAEFFNLGGLRSLCEDSIQELEAKEEENFKKRSVQLRDAFREVLEKFEYPGMESFKNKMLGATRAGSYIRRGEPVFATDLDF